MTCTFLREKEVVAEGKLGDTEFSTQPIESS